MFERFTDRARTVVVLAQEEARGLGHDHIGTEHLLLGLLAQGDGVGARVLNARGVTLERVRADVVSIVGSMAGTPDASIPFTPRAKAVLEFSLRESLRLAQDYIGTEHILLGLLDEGAGVAVQVLGSYGLSVDDARAAVLREVGKTERLSVAGWPLSVAGWRGGQHVRQGLARRQNTTPAVVELYLRARELAGHEAVSSGHMLRALVVDSDSQAARALASLGVGAADVERAITSTPTPGTTDETPEAAIARIALIRAEGGRVVIELDDADLAQRLGTGMIELSGSVAPILDQLRARLRREAGPSADE